MNFDFTICCGKSEIGALGRRYSERFYIFIVFHTTCHGIDIFGQSSEVILYDLSTEKWTIFNFFSFICRFLIFSRMLYIHYKRIFLFFFLKCFPLLEVGHQSRRRDLGTIFCFGIFIIDYKGEIVQWFPGAFCTNLAGWSYFDPVWSLLPLPMIFMARW